MNADDGLTAETPATGAGARTERRGLRHLIAVVATAGVLVLCWLPSSDTHHIPMHGMDKLLHAAAFYAIALVWLFAGMRVWQVLLGGFGLAVVTELGQWILASGRTGDVKDVVADMAGLLAGIACARLGAKLRPGPRAD